MEKRAYILCLLAACYKYLDEDKLAEQALDEAEAAVSYIPQLGEQPANLYDYFVREYMREVTGGRYRMNLSEYRRTLSALPAGELPK
jgi:hypothetical protein